MALPHQLPERYERKTPIWVLLLLAFGLTAVSLLAALVASGGDSLSVVTWTVLLALPLASGYSWFPVRALARRSRVALVFDANGFEDRTGLGAPRRVQWSGVKAMRALNGPYFKFMGVWLNDGAGWLTTSKGAAHTKNAWSREDFRINQTFAGLTTRDAVRLVQH